MSISELTHLDFLGNLIVIGEGAVYADDNNIGVAVVTGFTPTMVKVQFRSGKQSRKIPSKLVQINRADMIMYMMQTANGS